MSSLPLGEGCGESFMGCALVLSADRADSVPLALCAAPAQGGRDASWPDPSSGDRAAGDDLGAMVLSDRGDRNGLCVDLFRYSPVV